MAAVRNPDAASRRVWRELARAGGAGGFRAGRMGMTGSRLLKKAQLAQRKKSSPGGPGTD